VKTLAELRDVATRAAILIVADLDGRSGVLDGIDDEIVLEIQQDITDIIEREFAKAESEAS
jgi:hypothetical protein